MKWEFNNTKFNLYANIKKKTKLQSAPQVRKQKTNNT